MSRRRSESKGRSKRRRTALFIIIFAEAIFITVTVLSGFIPRLVSGGEEKTPSPRDIVRYMFMTLIDPYERSFINPVQLGLINNTQPIVTFIAIDDWRMVGMTCGVWGLLNKSRSLGWRVILVVLPQTLDRFADPAVIREFLGYAHDICGIDISRITNETYTAFWRDLKTLLAFLAVESGRNTTVALPILMFVGKNDTLKALYMGEEVLNATIPPGA